MGLACCKENPSKGDEDTKQEVFVQENDVKNYENDNSNNNITLNENLTNENSKQKESPPDFKYQQQQQKQDGIITKNTQSQKSIDNNTAAISTSNNNYQEQTQTDTIIQNKKREEEEQQEEKLKKQQQNEEIQRLQQQKLELEKQFNQVISEEENKTPSKLNKCRFMKTQYVNSKNIKELSQGVLFLTDKDSNGQVLCSDIAFDNDDKQIYLSQIEISIIQSNNNNQQQSIQVGLVMDGQQNFWKHIGRYGCNVDILNLKNVSSMENKFNNSLIENDLSKPQRITLKYDEKLKEFSVILNNEQKIFVSKPNKKLNFGNGDWRFSVAIDGVSCQIKIKDQH